MIRRLILHPNSYSRWLVIIFTLLISSTQVSASEVGAQYQQLCGSCHGASAEGNDALGSPALAGQSAEYLARQIENFKTGMRGAHEADTYGQQMAAISTTLVDSSAIRAMSEYLADLSVASQSTAQGDIKNGYKYYQGCGSCHGAKAQGNQALSAPRLAGLSAEYMFRQHKSFNAGWRGTHKDDRYGRQMKMMAATVNDELILRDIIAYITSIED